MTLWIVLTLLVALGVAAMTVPLVARYQDRSAEPSAARAVYRQQLAEIDGQQAGGAVSAEEAEALRVEAKRRLLAEDRYAETAARPLGQRALGRLALGVAAVVALGSTLLYSQLGDPTVQSRAPVSTGAAAGGAADSQQGMAAMAGQLEARLQQNPSDAEGWRMLGLTRYSLEQFGPAAEAYAKAAALTPDNGELQSALGEAQVLAANGQVTPAAQAAFRKAVSLVPKDARARYFLGLAKDQAGDRKGAVEDWIAIINDAPAGAAYVPGIRSVAERAAAQAGMDLTGRIKTAAAAPTTVAPPPLGPPGATAPSAPTAPAGPGGTTAGGIPNPTAEQMAAASRMPPSQQQEMIRAMVDGLAARLKSNPQDAEGWLRLMRARIVLGEADAAGQARREALAALKDPAAKATVEAGAKALGVPGA